MICLKSLNLSKLFVATHHRATECHLPCGITQCTVLLAPLPQTQVNVPQLNPSHEGRYSIFLPQRYGRLSWPW